MHVGTHQLIRWALTVEYQRNVTAVAIYFLSGSFWELNVPSFERFSVKQLDDAINDFIFDILLPRSYYSISIICSM